MIIENIVNPIDISSARQRIQSQIYPTPIFLSEKLSSITGKNIYIKPEYTQKTGSFKFRGALNMILGGYDKKFNGLIAGSSGNHAIAVSMISSSLNIPATICLPEDAPEVKKNKIQSFNPILHYFDRNNQDREILVNNLASSLNLFNVPSSDHELIIAGAGTVGVEMIEEFSEFDLILVPIGGGGLASGVAIATQSSNPKVKIIGVEPELGCDTKISIDKDIITRIKTPATIADGLKNNQPGNLTFEIMKKRLEEIITVSEVDIYETFLYAHETLKLNIEPSSAIVIAALLKKIPNNVKNIGLILTGSNYDNRLLIK